LLVFKTLKFAAQRKQPRHFFKHPVSPLINHRFIAPGLTAWAREMQGNRTRQFFPRWVGKLQLCNSWALEESAAPSFPQHHLEHRDARRAWLSR